MLGLQSSAPCDSAQAYRDGGNQFNPCGYESEQHDRTRLTLPKIQQDLGKAVLTAAKKHNVPAAVVLVHGGTLAVEGLKADADAIAERIYLSLSGEDRFLALIAAESEKARYLPPLQQH